VDGTLSTPEFERGQKATWTKTIAEADVYAFAGITGDFNPLHVDREYAAGSRFGERISHGMLTAGLISAVLGMGLPGPGGIFLSQSLKFLKPVRFGDTITAEAEVLSYRADRRILTVRTTCTNQRGEAVIEGEAVLLVEKVEKQE
jgi:3-hydroxybutyryl-CoA dehydratase